MYLLIVKDRLDDTIAPALVLFEIYSLTVRVIYWYKDCILHVTCYMSLLDPLDCRRHVGLKLLMKKCNPREKGNNCYAIAIVLNFMNMFCELSNFLFLKIFLIPCSKSSQRHNTLHTITNARRKKWEEKKDISVTVDSFSDIVPKHHIMPKLAKGTHG